MKNKITKIASMFFLLVLTTNLGFAMDGIGVSSPYWNENPLKMYPGESATVNMNLQITPDTKDSYFKAEILDDGKGIATLTEPDLIYRVKSGGKTSVPIKISIPESIQFGETRIIQIRFAQVSLEDTGGMLILQTEVEGKFPVQIVAEEESSLYNTVEEKDSSSIWYWIIGILLLIGILYLIFRRKNN